jgi:hypothetical protein
MLHKSYEQERQTACGCGGRGRGYQYDSIREEATDFFYENNEIESFAPNRESVFFSEPYCDRTRVYSPVNSAGGESGRRRKDEEDKKIVIVNVLFNFVKDDPIGPPPCRPSNTQPS